MQNYNHLHADAQKWLELSNDERIERLNGDLWIGYSQAQQILEKMNELLVHPRISRMPNLLIIGRTNNGKTQILRRFQELNPASDNLGGHAIRVPVLYVQAPPIPDEKRFYANVLDALFAKYAQSASPAKLFANIKEKFELVGVRMLIIDEMNSLVAGSLSKQRQFLTVLKYLSNELQIPIVGAGTEDAVRALQTDPQLSNRFIPMTLPRWKMDADFRRLLATWEKLLPLKLPSELSAKLLAHEIWSLSEGTIGELVLLLKASARYAIMSGKEMIDRDVIAQCGYEKPSDRKKRLLEV